jgi:hypothetical protein
MKMFRFMSLSLVLLSLPWAGAAGPSDIVIENPQPLEFQLRMSIAPGTEQVYCYQQDRQQVVGTTRVSAGSSATVAVSMPDPVIRCTACNAYGCSSLSPNAAVVVGGQTLDFNRNGRVDVGDMLTCVEMVREQLY